MDVASTTAPTPAPAHRTRCDTTVHKRRVKLTLGAAIPGEAMKTPSVMPLLTPAPGRRLTPAQDPQAVHHGHVGVRANDTVGEEDALLFTNHPRQVLQVHLMSRPGSGGDHSHVLKHLRTPLHRVHIEGIQALVQCTNLRSPSTDNY